MEQLHREREREHVVLNAYSAGKTNGFAPLLLKGSVVTKVKTLF